MKITHNAAATIHSSCAQSKINGFNYFQAKSKSIWTFCVVLNVFVSRSFNIARTVENCTTFLRSCGTTVTRI